VPSDSVSTTFPKVCDKTSGVERRTLAASRTFFCGHTAQAEGQGQLGTG